MDIQIWYDLECTKCGKHFSTDFKNGMYSDKKQIKETAKSQGWIYENKSNICPLCNNK